jgi:hypothetical protein
MPRGDKSSYTDKQKRKARHIEAGYEERGVSEKEAARRAWATVNKQDHGGKRSGPGVGSRRTRPRLARGAVCVDALRLGARLPSDPGRPRRLLRPSVPAGLSPGRTRAVLRSKKGSLKSGRSSKEARKNGKKVLRRKRAS